MATSVSADGRIIRPSQAAGGHCTGHPREKTCKSSNHNEEVDEWKMFETSVHATTVATMTRLTCAMSRRDECSAFFPPPDSFINIPIGAATTLLNISLVGRVADEIFPFLFAPRENGP